MAAYYNENNEYAADWLENLISSGLIPGGDVDRRSVRDVRPDDVASYRQCHFFAGIGGWAHAARLAGWPDDRALWTGSCPCQPFSVAGKGKGVADDRHLWPDFYRIIAGARPAVIFGEQVAGKDGLAWLDGVFADLEAGGYAARAFVVPACSVDAPHRRERLWFAAKNVANADGVSSYERGAVDERRDNRSDEATRPRFEGRGILGDLGDADGARLAGREIEPTRKEQQWPTVERASGSFWSGAEWIDCADGKTRRIEPRIPLLVDGLPRNVAGALAGFGNAIVPQVAAEILGAWLDVEP